MYLPLFFKADELSCLIIGGGKVALHKMDKLTSLSSSLTMISPEIIPEVNVYVHKYKIKLLRREFQNGDCKDYDLIIAATSNRDVNRKIADEAKALHIPVNVVDDPELCTVIFSADHRDGDFIVAISTSGKAPYLAGGIRNKIAHFTSGLGHWVKIASQFRMVVNRDVVDPARKKYYLKLFATRIPERSLIQPRPEDDLDVWLDWLMKMDEE